MPGATHIQIASILIIGVLIGAGPGYFLPEKSTVVEAPVTIEETHEDGIGHQEVSDGHDEGQAQSGTGHDVEGMQMTEEDTITNGG